MLFDSAVEFEYHSPVALYDKIPPPQDHPLVQHEYSRAGAWFALFATLPFDATFDVIALLDCLRFAMKNRMLDQLYMVESLQLGFPFGQTNQRYLWVHVIETLLFNFNVQTKYMMQPNIKAHPLPYLNWFSQQRVTSQRNHTGDPYFGPYSTSDVELMQNKLLSGNMAIRFLSMPRFFERIFKHF